MAEPTRGSLGSHLALWLNWNKKVMLVILEWQLQLSTLKHALSGMVTMNPLTAPVFHASVWQKNLDTSVVSWVNTTPSPRSPIFNVSHEIFQRTHRCRISVQMCCRGLQ